MRSSARLLRSGLGLGLVLIGVLVGILTPPRTSADSLAPPPTDCPQGTYGRSSRGGSYCAPTQCGDETHTCPPQPHCPVQSWPCPSPEPWRCEDTPRGLCVLTSTSSGSRPGPRGGIPWTDEITQSLGSCTTDADCTRGAHCETARRCVHEPAPTPPPITAAPAPSTTTTPPTTTPASTAPPHTNSSADASAGGLCSLTAHRSTGRRRAVLALSLPALVLLARRGKRAGQGARKCTSAKGSGSRSNANVTA